MQSMIISWLITGIVIGTFSALVPTYILEISLIYICGALESANQFVFKLECFLLCYLHSYISWLCFTFF
jgi:hypothetical protein